MRLSYGRAFPEGLRAMRGLEEVVSGSGLDPMLLELIRIRSSQINGCAFCLDMHTKDAQARGESGQRLHLVAAWREATVFSDPERAALAWCEALTRVAETHAPDEVYAEVAAHFTERDLVALTMAIVAINGWNRLAVGFRLPAGDYVSPHAKQED